MSTSPAPWAHQFDCATRQGPSKDAHDAVQAEKGRGLRIAPVFDIPFAGTQNPVTDRTSGNQAHTATTPWPERAGNGDLERVQAIICELQNEACRLPRAAQLPPIPGLPAVDVPGAVAKRSTIKRVPVPPLRPRRDESSGLPKFLIAAAISVPLACYFAVAGPHPIFGKAAAPEFHSVDRPSLTVLPLTQAMPVSTFINRNSLRAEVSAALEPQDTAPPIEAGGQTAGAGDRTAVRPPPHREADAGDDIPAMIDHRDGFIIADSDLRYLTRSELEKLSKFAWYRPSAWNVPLNPVEYANMGSIQWVETPAAARDAVSRPFPNRKDTRKDFTLADSGRQYLTREELQGLSADQLLIARNEIFARNGRHFKDDALRDYFSQFSWYQPHAWDVSLTPAEKANVELIQSVEQSLAGSKQATSLGRAR